MNQNRYHKKYPMPGFAFTAALLGGLMVLPAAAQTASATVWDWNGIIGTGQSLSVGATPLISEEQSFGNLQLSRGDANEPPYDAGSSELEMIPLVEQVTARGYPAPYPGNLYGETPHTAMASEITLLAKKSIARDYVTVHTIVGESGQGMNVIRKGAKDTGTTGRAYAASIFEITAITRLAKAKGKTWGVQAITMTHGETDAGNGAYLKELVKLLNNYNEDIKAITGQTQDVIMLLVQQHSCPNNGTSASTLAQWKAGLDNSGKFVCIGPNYQRIYGPDGVHLTSEGYRLLGEKYGQVYHERVILGHDWQPLQPQRISTAGKTVTIDFHVPVGPLVWDTTMEPPYQDTIPEWKNGKGFEVWAPGGRVTIEAVEISGNAVIITCDKELPAKGVKVGYAVTGEGKFRPNGSFHWGLLRDSDPFAGASGVTQANFCVAFETTLPFPKK